MPFSNHMEQKTFTEGSCSNKYTLRKKLFVRHFCILWSLWVFLVLLENRRANKCWLWEINVVFHIYILSVWCAKV